MHALVGNAAFAAIFGASDDGATTTTAAKGGTGFAAGRRTGEPYALTGAGAAMSLVYAASRAATGAQALSLGSPNLVGIDFTAGATHRLLIANLGAAPASIQLGALVPHEWHLQELSAPPGRFVASPDTLHSQDRKGTGTLTIEPWSLSVVE